MMGDLRCSSLRLPSVNGILLANSLHFIQGQQLFLTRLLSEAVAQANYGCVSEGMGSILPRRKAYPAIPMSR